MFLLALVLAASSAHALKKEPIQLLLLKTECSEITLSLERDLAAQQKHATTASEIAWISAVAHDKTFSSKDGGDDRPAQTWKALVARLETEAKALDLRGWLGAEGAKLADQVLKVYSDPRTHSWAAGIPADTSYEKKLQELLKKKGISYHESGGCD